MIRKMKAYLARPENGAGLLFVALAFGVVRLWLLRQLAPTDLAGRDPLLLAWTAVTFAMAVTFAFLLLRRRLTHGMLRRVLFITLVHAVAGIRFYDFGMLLLSVMPLFALAPALLLPAVPRTGMKR